MTGSDTVDVVGSGTPVGLSSWRPPPLVTDKAVFCAEWKVVLLVGSSLAVVAVVVSCAWGGDDPECLLVSPGAGLADVGSDPLVLPMVIIVPTVTGCEFTSFVASK